MACPNCDHTMQSLGTADRGHRLFWCPRCGTLKAGAQAETPKLVDRCRTFEATLADYREWRRIGIAESIAK